MIIGQSNLFCKQKKLCTTHLERKKNNSRLCQFIFFNILKIHFCVWLHANTIRNHIINVCLCVYIDDQSWPTASWFTSCNTIYHWRLRCKFHPHKTCVNTSEKARARACAITALNVCISSLSKCFVCDRARTHARTHMPLSSHSMFYYMYYYKSFIVYFGGGLFFFYLNGLKLSHKIEEKTFHFDFLA